MPSASPSPSLHPNHIYLSVQHSLSTCCLTDTPISCLLALIPTHPSSL